MKLTVYLRGARDVSEFVKSATLSGDSQTINRQLTLELTATSDGRTKAFYVEEGDAVKFFVDGVVRFMGVVFAQDISSDGSLTLTCYDTNIYLVKSNDTRIFKNKTASQIIKMLARDFEIPIGNIADTKYVIPYLRLSNRTLSDMVLMALTLTQKQTGKRFFIKNINGKLTLDEGYRTNPRYIFKDGVNLISARYSRSIEDTKTQIKVIGGKKGKETAVTVKHAKNREKYGVLQAVESMDESATASQIKQRAATLLKEQSVVDESLSIEVLGIPQVDIGTPVYVQNAMTATDNAYYVTTITHSYSANTHTMSLGLSRSFDIPDIDIDESATKKDDD